MGHDSPWGWKYLRLDPRGEFREGDIVLVTCRQCVLETSAAWQEFHEIVQWLKAGALGWAMDSENHYKFVWISSPEPCGKASHDH